MKQDDNFLVNPTQQLKGDKEEVYNVTFGLSDFRT